MDRNRVIMALALSLLVLFTWPFVMRRFFPPPPEEPIPFEQTTSQQPAQPPPTKPDQTSAKKPSAPASSTVRVDAPQREIEIENSPYWRASFSSKGGGLATSWTIEAFPENGAIREIKG